MTEFAGRLTERLSRCYTGVVHDVMRDMGLVGYTLPSALRPLATGRVIAGPAWTYSGSMREGVDPHTTLLEWTRLLTAAPTGHVLVCQPHDHTVAHTGELSAEALQVRGILGMVIDGGARDIRFLRDREFQVFCRYFTPRDIVGCWVPDRLGEPVKIGDVTVSTGDFILGDDDGLQLVPRDHVEPVVAAAEAAVGQENLVRKAILDGVDPEAAYLAYGKF